MNLIQTPFEETKSKEATQAFNPVKTAGLELLKSLQISPGNTGIGGASANWRTSQIDVDAPGDFSKYRKFLFQFSNLGFENGNVVNIELFVRKNGGAGKNVSMYKTTMTQTGASTSTFVQNAGVASVSLGNTSDLTNSAGIRSLDIYMDQMGFKTIMQKHSNSNLNPTEHITLANFLIAANPFYGQSDSCGVSLTILGSNYFTSPRHGATPVYCDIPLYCDIYGYTIK